MYVYYMYHVTSIYLLNPGHIVHGATDLSQWQHLTYGINFLYIFEALTPFFLSKNPSKRISCLRLSHNILLFQRVIWVFSFFLFRVFLLYYFLVFHFVRSALSAFTGGYVALYKSSLLSLLLLLSGKANHLQNIIPNIPQCKKYNLILQNFFESSKLADPLILTKRSLLNADFDSSSNSKLYDWWEKVRLQKFKLKLEV